MAAEYTGESVLEVSGDTGLELGVMLRIDFFFLFNPHMGDD